MDYKNAGTEFARFLVQEARRRHEAGEDFDGKDLIIGCNVGIQIAGGTPEDLDVFNSALNAEVANVRATLDAEPSQGRSQFPIVRGDK